MDKGETMKVGIDLLWIKHKVTGGMESYARNLLMGFQLYSEKDIEFILYFSKDNYESFKEYLSNNKFEYRICNIESVNVGKRILWQNLFFNNICANDNIDILFTPIYSKVLFNKKGIKYITTIHDLQALHFPEYFSKTKNIWLKYAWKRCAHTSHRIIAISKFVKQDIVEKLRENEDKIEVIYNPIIKSKIIIDFSEINTKYNIDEYEYFYTVSSMLPHKNLKTLLFVMSKLVSDKFNLPKKLIISGVGGKSHREINNLIKELGLENNITLTGFVSDEERDCLYKHAKIFLFPSVFEGFGMPPIEALKNGTPVVMTDKTCLKEITKGKALYVEDSFCIEEWIHKIEEAVKVNREIKEFPEYELEKVTNEYINQFKSV
jgi:glycosyltransferase involved in cell wall biosynthesis